MRGASKEDTRSLDLEALHLGLSKGNDYSPYLRHLMNPRTAAAWKQLISRQTHWQRPIPIPKP